MTSADYDGPYRHIHVSVSETGQGLSCTVLQFEIFKGQRRFVRRWPPILLRWEERPRSVAHLLRRVGTELDPQMGHRPPGAPLGGPRGGNPQP